MSQFHTIIMTPQAKAFDGQAESLVVPGVTGRFGVLKDHARMFAGVRPGLLKLKAGDGERFFAIGQGTATMMDGTFTLVVEAAVPVTPEDAAAGKLPELASADALEV